MKADELFDGQLDVDVVDPVGDIGDETPQDAAVDVETPEADEPSPEAETDEQADAVASDKSYLVDDEIESDEADEEAEPAGKFVPDERFALQRERDRRRQLERELAEVRAANLAEQDDDPGDEVGDEDFLTVAQTRKMAAKLVRDELAKKDAEIAQIRQTEQTKVKLLESEQAFRSKVGDYDSVLQTAIAEDVLTPGDRQAAYRAKDPAKALYLAAKRNLSFLGMVPEVPVQTQKQTQSQPPGSETGDDVSPEKVFDEIFG